MGRSSQDDGNTHGNTVSTVSHLPAGEFNFESSAILMCLTELGRKTLLLKERAVPDWLIIVLKCAFRP